MANLPPLRTDLVLHPSTPTATGTPTWVIYDPVRHRYFQIGQVEFELLRQWHQYSAEKLLQSVNESTSLHVSEEILKQLLDFLIHNQLIKATTEATGEHLFKQAQRAKSNIGTWLLHHYLFFRIPVICPDKFLTATLPYIRFLFSRGFHVFMLCCALLGIFLVSRQSDSFFNTFLYFFTWQGAVTFAAALFFAKVIHEFGHAYAAKYFGLSVSTMGVALLVMWPVLYTDNSDAWKLTSRRQRLLIDGAGIIAELSLAVFATLLWSFLPDGVFKSAVFMLAAVTWGMTLLINSNPCMRFDGYYLLADYLGINNLQERSFALGRWLLREKLFALNDPIPEHLPIKQQRILITYAYATWIYRFFLFIGIALLVYYFFFKLLGIFLMVVEIIWFILRPIYKEIHVWFSRRADMQLNRHTIVSFSLFLALLISLFIPWQTDLHLPAIYRSSMTQKMYAPLPAQLKAIHVEAGQTVKQGDLLFEFSAPDIQHQLAVALSQRDLLRLQVQLQPADRSYLELTHVMEQQLAEAETTVLGLQTQVEQLLVRAPVEGTVVYLDPQLHIGRWFSPQLPLVTLANSNHAIITAYLHEDEVTQIKVGATGQFYSSQDEHSIEAIVTDIDAANINRLQPDDYYIASIYKGDIAVQPVEKQQLAPHSAIYRVQLSTSTLPPVQVKRGQIVIARQQPEAAIQGIWKVIYSVLIRESGL